MGSVPVHIGIIMDGNGRWAKQRGLVRTQGHSEGLKAAKRIVKAASEAGVKYLTLYAFSTENWKRTVDEVSFIMGLVKQYLKSELDFYKENNIRIRFAGNMEGLPEEIQNEIKDSMEATSFFSGIQVILAINYGGRDEIIRAVKKIAGNYSDLKLKEFSQDISEKLLSGNLDNPDIPDPDLIIRSAGEYRTSNFLLWEAAYSEIYISQKFWPQWDKEDLESAIADFQKRDRRYGAQKSG